TAPAAAHKDMYLDAKGEVIAGLSIDGPLSAAIPGVPAALVHLAEKYGKLDLKTSLRPAIDIAKNGFEVDERYRLLTGFRKDSLNKYSHTAKLFLKDGEVPPLGHVIKQTDLAEVLEQIASKKNKGFYQGNVAKKLVDGVVKAGGNWTLADLENYKIVEREPIKGSYKGIEIVAAPLPSSGGVALLEMLNILSGFELEKLDEVTQKHLVVEAMRRAYRDRAEYAGDPDFVSVPVKRLASKDYADGLRASIRMDKATLSSSLPGIDKAPEGPHTTHFSILDKEGNRVSATVTINYPFGSAFVPPGTGVVLNDEMDDFSSKPGVPNAYGLVGSHANAIAPGKRPLSSMTPTFLNDGKRIAVLGTPGGSRIITMVLLGILDYAKGNGPESWVKIGRFHHQFLPDHIEYEPDGLDSDTLNALGRLGHNTKNVGRHYGNMHAVQWNLTSGRVSAASDPRGVGKAATQ
ncbi:MAG: gamma-glutamyltransferase, partial [Gammaproteobacteria bacterium]|nr:gamma-glutamyltransferase [Gammaproteobacteria bacterium]